MRLLARLLVVGFLVVWGLAVFGVLIPAADAASYVNACSTAPGDPDPGTVSDDAIETREQRQEDAANCAALAERLAAIDSRLAAMDDAAGTAAQRVALSASDRERLDLTWYGLWALVGLALVQLIAAKWYGAWRFWRE